VFIDKSSDKEKEHWVKLDWNEATYQPNPHLLNDIQDFCKNNELFK
jgi:histidinol-phosphate/aromatic aminotransferase/cobyric acid decarboxylase-like protein